MNVRRLGVLAYEPVFEEMRAFNEARGSATEDEIWLLEHLPVYTQGMNGRQEHLPRTGEIPLVKSDRGGQVTYHGPGQLVVYLLLDLKRAGLGVKELVKIMERAAIALLADYGVSAYSRDDAPGVYVDGAKIASLGLRVRRGCCYHGLALNVNPDLAPFQQIDPCGFRSLRVTSLEELGIAESVFGAGEKLLQKLLPMIGKK